MADKMWDILRFLKNPENDTPSADISQADSETEIKHIGDQLQKIIEKTEQAADEMPVAGESIDEHEISTGESVFLTSDLEDISPSESAPSYERQKSEERKTVNENRFQTFSRMSDDVEEKEFQPEEGRLLKIPIGNISPNPYQPRKIMDDDEIKELSDSIRELGILQPILVKPLGEGFELIAGERRLRVAKLADLTEIPALVVKAEPLTQQVIALVENMQRKNLTSIEEAICLQEILSKTGWSQTELSHRMGRSQASIANKIRLLRLDSSVQELILTGKLGERQARSLLSLPPSAQKSLAQKSIEEELSAREMERLANSWKDGSLVAQKTAKKSKTAAEGKISELLHDIATMINKHRNDGLYSQWNVKEMSQTSLTVEISIDLDDDKNSFVRDMEESGQ